VVVVTLLGRSTRLTSKMTGTVEVVPGVMGLAMVLLGLTSSAVVLGAMSGSAVVFETTSTRASASG